MRNEHLISAQALESRANDDIVIVDCRFDLLDPEAGLRAYEQAHIPGAVFADLERDLSGPISETTGRHPLPDARVLADSFGRLGIDRSIPVVAYDAASGALAARCWWLLRWLGHDDVRLLDGGLAAWERQGFSLDSGAAHPQPRIFGADPRDGMLLDVQELIDNGATADGLNLIDARDSLRFRGEAEPIDAVAGHIPGALNLPFAAMLDTDESWLPDDAVRELWAGTVGEDPAVETAVMCGSGVTACHLVLSALMAGYREPRVYVGSWSEWIRDPRRPVATGPV